MIVLDSSFLVAFHNQRDAHHQAACGLMERFLKGEWGQGLLLEYVFLEVTTVLLVRRDLGMAAQVGRLLLDADELDFVPCSDFFSDAFEMFTQQGETRLSFADAAMAYVACERAGGLVLTFDEVFGKLPGIRVPTEPSLMEASQVGTPDSPESPTATPGPTAAIVPTDDAIAELIAQCYRAVTPEELSQIRQMHLDPNSLEQKLNSVLRAGGVAADSSLQFFMAKLLHQKG